MLKKASLFPFFTYTFVFLCFLCMYFFIVPQSDVFLFARGTDGSLASAFESALYYGNGRFLGNFISMFLSNHFEYASFLIAITMTFCVFAINNLLFDKNSKTVFFSALIIAFPSIGIVRECYYLFAAFTNYMFPIALILLTLILLKKFKTNSKQNLLLNIISLLLLFALGFSSCLFSENTSIVLAALAFLLIVNDVLNKKKLSLHNALYFISVFLGSLTLLLIPKITETSWKMDHYRSVSTSITDIIFTAPGSFVKFSQIFNGFIPTILIVTVAFILVAKKYYQNKKFFGTIISIFLLTSILSLILNFLSLTSLYIPWIYFSQAIILFIFICACLVSSFLIPDKKIKWISLSFLFLLSASIAPMMIVNQYGHRTYVITNYIGVFMGIYLIRAVAPLTFWNKIELWKKQINHICLACFLFATIFLSSQTVYNYNFYAARTNHIAEQIMNDSEKILVPILPCNSTSIEDEWSNILIDISHTHARKIVIADFNHCENAEEYKNILASTLPEQIVLAFDNLEFKDPLLIEKISQGS